jgi:hypothetical protein
MRPLRRLPVLPFAVLGLSLFVGFADAIARPRAIGHWMMPALALASFLWLLIVLDRRR